MCFNFPPDKRTSGQTLVSFETLSCVKHTQNKQGLMGENNKCSLIIRIHTLGSKGVCRVDLHALMMKATVDFKASLSLRGQRKKAARNKSIFSC